MNKLKYSSLFLSALCICLFLLAGLDKTKALSASFVKRDEVITAQIQAKILADPILLPLNLRIQTSEAIVSIRGQVPHVAEAKRVVILVNSTAGVKGVQISELLIKKSSPQSGQKKNTETLSSDDFISSLLIGLYLREGIIDVNQPSSATISVKTQAGVVYLSGILATEEMVKSAIDLAETLPGVLQVQARLTVPK